MPEIKNIYIIHFVPKTRVMKPDSMM